MNPLPKWAGMLGVVAALFASLNTAGIFAMLPPKWQGVVAAVGSLVAVFSHSLTGDGGAAAAKAAGTPA